MTLGDVGYFDDDGDLFLCDRKIDMVISGGVNIYPAEVEACLLGHAAVADVAVIGVPDDEWGESVQAIVERPPAPTPDPVLADALVDHCRERIARFKCPRRVEFVDGAAAPAQRQGREATPARAPLGRARPQHLTGGQVMGVRLDDDEAWAELDAAHTGILTTLRRDGWPVSLPVWFASARAQDLRAHAAEDAQGRARSPRPSRHLPRRAR